MKVQFKYSRIIDGQHFVPGTYEIPESLADHWFFKGLVTSGDVKIIEEAIESSDAIQESKDADLEVSEPKPSKSKRSKRS